MEWIEKLIPGLLSPLPPWVLIPIITVLLLIRAWPGMREIWRDAVPFYRYHTREKMRLELLKLQYEIEALKKQHNLSDQTAVPKRPDAPNPDVVFNAPDPGAIIDHRDDGLMAESSRPIVVSFGFLGGIALPLTRFLASLVANPEFVWPTWVFFLGVFINGAVGCLIALAFRPRTARDAFLMALTVIVLIQTLITAFADVQRPPLIRTPSG